MTVLTELAAFLATINGLLWSFIGFGLLVLGAGLVMSAVIHVVKANLRRLFGDVPKVSP